MIHLIKKYVSIFHVPGQISDNCCYNQPGGFAPKKSSLPFSNSDKWVGECVLSIGHLCPAVPRRHLSQNTEEMFMLVTLSY